MLSMGKLSHGESIIRRAMVGVAVMLGCFVLALTVGSVFFVAR